VLPQPLIHGDWFHLERVLKQLEAGLTTRIDDVEAQLATAGPDVVALTGDVGPTSSNTLANVTGLAFAVAANSDYRFEFTVLYQAAATTHGIQLALTAPAGATLTYSVEIPQADGTTDGDVEGQGTASGDVVQSSVTITANTTFAARIVGVVRVAGTAGTLQVQHATSTFGNNITTKAGSSGVLYSLT
jgi:hypothetical protein